MTCFAMQSDPDHIGIGVEGSVIKHETIRVEGWRTWSEAFANIASWPRSKSAMRKRSNEHNSLGKHLLRGSAWALRVTFREVKFPETRRSCGKVPRVNCTHC
jgi:hypothetical protein